LTLRLLKFPWAKQALKLDCEVEKEVRFH